MRSQCQASVRSPLGESRTPACGPGGGGSITCRHHTSREAGWAGSIPHSIPAGACSRPLLAAGETRLPMGRWDYGEPPRLCWATRVMRILRSHVRETRRGGRCGVTAYRARAEQANLGQGDLRPNQKATTARAAVDCPNAPSIQTQRAGVLEALPARSPHGPRPISDDRVLPHPSVVRSSLSPLVFSGLSSPALAMVWFPPQSLHNRSACRP
jgi:hypothetical protein